jgi:type I restriction enzyme S subunit
MPEMKDSGIDTIGFVPTIWKESRLKYLCDVQTGNEDTQNSNPDGEYPFYVRSPIIEHCDRYTFDGEGILVAGDGAGAGRIFHHAFGKYAVHQRVYRLSNFRFNSRFVHYYLSNLFPHEMDKGSAQSTVPSMRLPMLLNFKFYLPDEDSARSIADFLDKKCAEIDALSADIQSEIDILEEYKKSVISEAVTRGLDSNIPMKESGVNWCPKIPIHWDIVSSKYLFRNSDVRRYEGDKLLTSSQSFGIISQAEYMDRTGMKIVLANQGLEKWKHVVPNDFIISLRSFQGGLEMSEITGCITWHYVVLKANRKICYRYYKWLFKSTQYINALQGTCNFIRDGQDLRYSNFIQVPLFELPISEQERIADYLDEKCKMIDETIQEKKEQLATLEEYKKSIIYEYVTGKKEVPAV